MEQGRQTVGSTTLRFLLMPESGMAPLPPCVRPESSGARGREVFDAPPAQTSDFLSTESYLSSPAPGCPAPVLDRILMAAKSSLDSLLLSSKRTLRYQQP